MAQKDQIFLETQTRTAKRTTNSEGRKRNLIPAIIYGPIVESTTAFLNNSFFVTSKAIAGSTIYTLQGDVLDGKPAMIKEIKRSPVENKILHVDLYSPDMTGTMVVEVPFDFQGEPEGVKEGGLIQEVRRSIELECPVSNIPKSIKVDISALKIGETLSMADITVPSEFKVMSAPEYAVLNITEIKSVAALDEDVAASGTAAEGTGAATGTAAEGTAAAKTNAEKS